MFNDLKKIYPAMPAACENALMTAARSVPVREHRQVFRPAFALALALMLALSCAAGAAFYPQIIGWFSSRYGESWAAWMQKGSVAAPQLTMECKGAEFTIDEVLARGRGLYILGSIRPQEGYSVADCDSPKVPEARTALRYANIYLEKIGVDGGAMLAPGCWGYGVEEQADGSLTFSIEAEDGMVIEPGTEYTLEMRVRTYGANANGSINMEDMDEQFQTFSVWPKTIND